MCLVAGLRGELLLDREKWSTGMEMCMMGNGKREKDMGKEGWCIRVDVRCILGVGKRIKGMEKVGLAGMMEQLCMKVYGMMIKELKWNK